MVIGSQYYFYMETQTALAVPEEDGCIVLYGSLQCPDGKEGADEGAEEEGGDDGPI